MFNRILYFSIQNRYAVLIATLLAMIVCGASYRHLIIDAVPDITSIQVQINTEAQGYSPYEVEQRITRPIEQSLAGIPSLEYTRSLSRYGLSQITAVFRDKTDIYFARQLVSQQLQTARGSLPSNILPQMGPIATGLGEIFQFIVENSDESTNPKTLEELREIQDWIVRPQLRTVSGVVDVNSIGGAAKQIVVSPDIDKLRAYSFTLHDLSEAIAANNDNVGAGFLEENGEQLLIRVPAQIKHPEQLEDIVVGVHGGASIRIKDIASVTIGSELRAGAATENGKEVVLGTVFMLMGENGREVAQRVSARLTQIASSVPAGVIVKPVYDRSHLVNSAISTVRSNLFEGAILVVAILFFALGNIRAALITACVIPLSMLMTIFGMVQGRLSANLMSLGALDFGLLVDGAVILVENCVKRMREATSTAGRALTEQERLDVLYKASTEVRKATTFGEIIIMVVYIPILSLTGIEGKMFHPMAIAVLLALGGAFILSLTFVPAAVAIFLKGEFREHKGVFDTIAGHYHTLLARLLDYPRRVILVATLVCLTSLLLLSRLGSEFIPSLDEGDIAMHALRIPGTSLTQAIGMQHKLEQAIQEVPEVQNVFAKIGTAEIATDPMPPSVADGYIILKPREEWPDPDKPKHNVVRDIEKRASAVPGSNYEFTQPIQMRFNELIAGVRADVAVKIFGDDMEVLFENAQQIEQIMSSIEGVADLKVEQVSGLPMVSIKPRYDITSYWGISSKEIQETVHTAYAGRKVSTFYQGDRSFPVVVRLPESQRTNTDQISQLPITIPAIITHQGASLATERAELHSEPPTDRFVTLQEVADIEITEGPNQISRENGKRRIVVTANVRGRDLGSFVHEAQSRIAKELNLPAGYWLGWDGQYEHLINAKSRLLIVIPVVLLTVFSLVYLTFRSLKNTLLVYSGIPFALSGGIMALWLRGIPLSISAAVGFIALCGVSVLNGLVLVTFIQKLLPESRSPRSAILEGAVMRLRPVLMTALVASLGFIPMAISQGTGSEVQRPLATVVIGGIVSSTILTLLVLPSLLLVATRSKGK